MRWVAAVAVAPALRLWGFIFERYDLTLFPIRRRLVIPADGGKHV
jgi:hypothetical protein